MEIKELFVRANETEQEVIEQIAGRQWELLMPERVTRTPMTLMEVVRYHLWDSGWIPDGLAGKTIEEIGNAHDHLLEVRQEELKSQFALYNQRAIAAVRALDNLDTIVHLTYGDFPARQFLQHNIGVRAFWAYDIARLIGAEFKLSDDFVEALMKEFSPVVETYRQYGMFPPKVETAADASPQTKLLAMVGRD